MQIRSALPQTKEVDCGIFQSSVIYGSSTEQRINDNTSDVDSGVAKSLQLLTIVEVRSLSQQSAHDQLVGTHDRPEHNLFQDVHGRHSDVCKGRR